MYWIDPNGGSPLDSFPAFCDMTTDSGGWTLVATKVSRSKRSFITSSFSTAAAATIDQDTSSCIHPSMRTSWDEVMFRFSDVTNIRVIYSWKAGSRPGVANGFDNFLMGYSIYSNQETSLYGFYKYSPADGGKRNPPTGFAAIPRLLFSSYGITESFDGSDKWLNLWYQVDNSGNYFYSDNRLANGTKCIAGYCYLNKPVWVMVR